MTGTMQVKMKADVDLIAREVPCQRVVEIALTAPEAATDHKRFPLNLGLVLDRSGSMGGEKIEQAKLTLKRIIEQMGDGDVVSVVAFDDSIRVLANNYAISHHNRQGLIHDIEQIRAGGSTNLTDGWLTGCNSVAEGPSGNYIKRTLLVSDGLANVGITNHSEIFDHASAIFERGITTSTFGVGIGFDEHLLEGMANKGGGNFTYIESANSIDQLILAEFKDLVAVTARNVTVEINLPAGVSATVPGEWTMKKEGQKITISLSDQSAGRTTTLFLKLLTPPGTGELSINVRVSYKDENGKKQSTEGDLTFHYATEEKVIQAQKDQDLLTRYAAVETGERMNEALKLERAGKRKDAQNLMRQTLAEYGPDMPVPTRERYEALSNRIDRGLEERDRKSFNYDSYQLKKHRHPDEH